MNAFRRWFTRQPDPHPDVYDPVLGAFRWSEAVDGWEASTSIPGIHFHLAGDAAPNSLLVAQAREIAGDLSSLITIFKTLLQQEVAKFPTSYAAEILVLEIESIDLFWPDRPTDGMVWLRGGNEYRMWRCDYKAGKLVNLGFDD